MYSALKRRDSDHVVSTWNTRDVLVGKCFRLLSETCVKIPKLLTISQKGTFVTHPVLKLIRCLLFSTIKDWEISNWSDQTKPYTESNGC